jgi:hypothetical protein
MNWPHNERCHDPFRSKFPVRHRRTTKGSALDGWQPRRCKRKHQGVPPFRLRIAELQRLLTLEAAVQDVEFDLQDVTQLRWNRQGTFDRLLELSIADSTEAA